MHPVNKAFFLLISLLLSATISAQQNNFESKRLSGRELDNMVAFAKFYGYIRHFSPGNNLDGLNWETFLLKKSAIIENIENNADLIAKLDTISAEIGKDIWVCNTNFCATRTNMHYRNVSAMKAKARYYLYNEQHGWGNRGVNKSNTETMYYVKKMQVPVSASLPKNILKPEEFVRLSLNNEAELCLPLTVYADDKGSLAHPYSYPDYPINGTKYTSSNRLVRIGSVIIAWNAIRHFYPYLKMMKIDWDKVLPDYIQRASVCKNEDEFKQLLQEFTVEYKDGQAHANSLQPKDSQPYFSPPIQINFAEEKAIVTYYEMPDTSVIKQGFRNRFHRLLGSD